MQAARHAVPSGCHYIAASRSLHAAGALPAKRGDGKEYGCLFASLAAQVRRIQSCASHYARVRLRRGPDPTSSSASAYVALLIDHYGLSSSPDRALVGGCAAGSSRRVGSLRLLPDRLCAAASHARAWIAFGSRCSRRSMPSPLDARRTVLTTSAEHVPQLRAAPRRRAALRRASSCCRRPLALAAFVDGLRHPDAARRLVLEYGTEGWRSAALFGLGSPSRPATVEARSRRPAAALALVGALADIDCARSATTPSNAGQSCHPRTAHVWR